MMCLCSLKRRKKNNNENKFIFVIFFDLLFKKLCQRQYTKFAFKHYISCIQKIEYDTQYKILNCPMLYSCDNVLV